MEHFLIYLFGESGNTLQNIYQRLIVKNDDNKQIAYLNEDNSFINMRPHGLDAATAAIEEAMKT